MPTALLETLATVEVPLAEYSHLIGAALEGQEGAAATVRLNGLEVTYPVTLSATDVLRIERTTGEVITRLYGTPAGGVDGVSLVTDPEGYVSVATSVPLTPRATHLALDSRVLALESGGGQAPAPSTASAFVDGPDAGLAVGGLEITWARQSIAVAGLWLGVSGLTASQIALVQLSLLGAGSGGLGYLTPEYLTVQDGPYGTYVLFPPDVRRVVSDGKVELTFAAPLSTLEATTQPDTPLPEGVGTRVLDAGGAVLAGAYVKFGVLTTQERVPGGVVATPSLPVDTRQTEVVWPANGAPYLRLWVALPDGVLQQHHLLFSPGLPQ